MPDVMIADTPEALTPSGSPRRSPPAAHLGDARSRRERTAARHRPDVRQRPADHPLRRRHRCADLVDRQAPGRRSDEPGTAVVVAQLREGGSLLPAAGAVAADATPTVHHADIEPVTAASSCCSRTWRRPSRATSSPAAAWRSPRWRSASSCGCTRLAGTTPRCSSSSGCTGTPSRRGVHVDASCRCSGTASASGTRPTSPDVHEAGDALFAQPRGLPHAARAVGPRSSTATTASTTCSSTRPRGTPIAVVDWQTCTVGTALTDVAYFIGAGLREEDRRAEEDALVRRYFDDLVAAGVVGYDWDRAGPTTARDLRRAPHGPRALDARRAHRPRRQMFMTWRRATPATPSTSRAPDLLTSSTAPGGGHGRRRCPWLPGFVSRVASRTSL